MRMRHAAVVAGLALGLMSGAAQAATVSYGIGFLLNGSLVTGSVQTDGSSGYLTEANIIGYSFTYDGQSFYSAPDRTYISGHGLYAFQNSLDFDFRTDGKATFYGDQSKAYFALTAPQANEYGAIVDFVFYPNEYTQQGNTGVELLGTSVDNVGGSALSSVPLPASAPMFGAALLSLAGLAYTAKRKKAAAAV